MAGVADFFRWLNDAHGLNFSIFYDAYDRDRFLLGLWTTLYISVFCIVLSVIIGMFGAWLQGVRSGVVRAAVQGYVQLFRNTPPLVQLLFFYFGVGTALGAMTGGGSFLSGVGWAIVSFSLFAGALNVEIFRSGIEAVPATTREAAEALGYSRLATYRHVVMPLALRIALPALGNNLVNLVKTTTLAYAIAVPELLYASAQIWSEVLNVREMMNVLLVSYILYVAALVYALGRLERALRIPGYTP
ncbi:MAG: amino acid ABC transporter permease [Microvirga sp.]